MSRQGGAAPAAEGVRGGDTAVQAADAAPVSGVSPAADAAPTAVGVRGGARAESTSPPARSARTGDGFAPAAAYAELAELSDTDLGARLLAATPTHEGRDPARLREWARTALDVGADMAGDPDAAASAGCGLHSQVTESTGGLRRDEVLLAEYRRRARGGTVVLYTDALDYARRVAEAAGWAADFPAAAVRAAALHHEAAHRLLHGPRGRELRRRLDHTAAAWGGLRIRGHVVGADEIAAHAYAHRRGRVPRSPLLLTAAVAATLAHAGPPAAAAGVSAHIPFFGGSA